MITCHELQTFNNIYAHAHHLLQATASYDSKAIAVDL